MKLIIFLILTLSVISCSTAGHGAYGNDMAKVVGPSTWEYWQANAGWDLYEAFDYEPDNDEIAKLTKLLAGKDFSFVVFATTYCEDCEQNIPRAFKVFKKTKIPEDRIKLFGLDESLKEPSGDYRKYEIISTPVIFIEIDKKVIGEASYPYQWLENFIEILEKYDTENK